MITPVSPKSFLLTPELASYLEAHNPVIDDLLRSLIDETQQLGGVAGMQISPEQGAFMTLLTRLLGVRFAVEVGTFTGYSSICVARALAPGGRLLCCDVSEGWTSIAQRYWRRDGLDDRVELRLGPALDTLQSLPAEPAIDLAFIDADKTGYLAYYHELLPRLSTTGVMVVDNVLWSGRVLNEEDDDADTAALREFNDAVAADPACEAVMLPIADGLTLIRRNP
jgi:caffeoyl-CoA O-methyltransferase